MIMVHIAGDVKSAGEGWCSGLEKHIIYPTPPTCSVNTARGEGPGQFSFRPRAAASRDLLLIYTWAGKSRDQTGTGSDSNEMSGQPQ